MYVVLCNVLPGSGYRLRATGKIGEVSGHSNLLRGFGAALAQPEGTHKARALQSTHKARAASLLRRARPLARRAFVAPT